MYCFFLAFLYTFLQKFHSLFDCFICMNISTITALDISKSYIQGNRRIAVLSGVCITFEQGKSYAITGRSGSGKSTLLHLLAGLDEPDSGSIRLQEQSGSIKSDFLGDLGIVFQRPYLLYELSVIENIVIKKIIQGAFSKQDVAQAENLLEEIGLKEIIQTPCHTLSGGEQQRIALLRALYMQPPFLLVDEPTAHVDDQTAQKIVELLLMYKEKYNIGLIIVTHDERIARQMQFHYELSSGVLQNIKNGF